MLAAENPKCGTRRFHHDACWTWNSCDRQICGHAAGNYRIRPTALAESVETVRRGPQPEQWACTMTHTDLFPYDERVSLAAQAAPRQSPPSFLRRLLSRVPAHLPEKHIIPFAADPRSADGRALTIARPCREFHLARHLSCATSRNPSSLAFARLLSHLLTLSRKVFSGIFNGGPATGHACHHYRVAHVLDRPDRPDHSPCDPCHRSSQARHSRQRRDRNTLGSPRCHSMDHREVHIHIRPARQQATSPLHIASTRVSFA